MTEEQRKVKFLPIVNPWKKNTIEFGPEQAEVDFVSGKSQELVWSKVWDFQNEHFFAYSWVYSAR